MTSSYLVWGAWFALFIVLEMLAVFGVVPWHTLSRTVWNLQQRYGWLTVPLVAGLAVLFVHLVRPSSVQEGDEKKEDK